jgi:hypothetical protein
MSNIDPLPNENDSILENNRKLLEALEINSKKELICEETKSNYSELLTNVKNPLKFKSLENEFEKEIKI